MFRLIGQFLLFQGVSSAYNKRKNDKNSVERERLHFRHKENTLSEMWLLIKLIAPIVIMTGLFIKFKLGFIGLLILMICCILTIIKVLDYDISKDRKLGQEVLPRIFKEDAPKEFLDINNLKNLTYDDIKDYLIEVKDIAMNDVGVNSENLKCEFLFYLEEYDVVVVTWNDKIADVLAYKL